MTVRKPSYRYHKARDCAVVTIDGHDRYLGEYDSPESWEKYHRLVAEWMASRNNPPPPSIPAETPLTVLELCVRYWRFAKSYYVKDDRPTSELATRQRALRFLRRLYGSPPVREFTPKKLKAVREAMVSHVVTRRQMARGADGEVVRDPRTEEPVWEEKVLRRGLARRFVNKQ